MPIYEYQCAACGYIFELLTERRKRKPKCPKCKAKAHKLISAPNVSYNGEGFTKQVKGKRDE